MSLNLFIIGPSGCGKSTQAQLIAEKYNLKHFSMGQLLRDEIAAKTEFGIKVKPYVDQGTWAPEDLVIDIIKDKLNKINNENFIIDGFPRILVQGEEVSNYLKSNNKPISALIFLSVTFEEITARRQKLGQSFQDANRSDNTPEAIAHRQKSYDDTINPILDYFSNLERLIKVDGNRPVEPIFDDICQIIDKINY